MNPTVLETLGIGSILMGPHLLLLIYALLVFLWTGFPFNLPLVFIDETIHVQMGQEEASGARRVYEVNQIHFHMKKKKPLYVEN